MGEIVYVISSEKIMEKKSVFSEDIGVVVVKVDTY